MASTKVVNKSRQERQWDVWRARRNRPSTSREPWAIAAKSWTACGLVQGGADRSRRMWIARSIAPAVSRSRPNTRPTRSIAFLTGYRRGARRDHWHRLVAGADLVEDLELNLG